MVLKRMLQEASKQRRRKKTKHIEKGEHGMLLAS
jgi:hypothetical protein